VPYFVSQHVMIVRNLMVLTPFVAIFCGRGLACILPQIRAAILRWGVAIVFAGAVAFNLAFAVYAGMSVGESGTSMNYDLVGLRDYMAGHQQTRFDLSPMVAEYLRQLDPAAVAAALPANPTSEEVVVCSWEGDNLLQWPANRWNLARKTFGPYDVNFNYYPTWWRNRIVMFDLDRARTLDVDGVKTIIAARNSASQP
jgi:hypothetical protein